MENGITIQDILSIISMIIAGLSLMITIVFNIINQHQIIKDNEPQLSFCLKDLNGMLYLMVHNVGKTKAQDIKINFEKINNNNNQELILDDLFKSSFELYPDEKVQGIISIYSNNLSTHIFPYVDVDISYKKDHFFRKVHYKRKIFFMASVDSKVIVNTNFDLQEIEENIRKLHKATLRLANYFDGCEVAPFDELNLIPGRHFQEELVDALEGKKTAKMSREECIKQKLRKNKVGE